MRRGGFSKTGLCRNSRKSRFAFAHRFAKCLSSLFSLSFLAGFFSTFLLISLASHAMRPCKKTTRDSSKSLNYGRSHSDELGDPNSVKRVISNGDDDGFLFVGVMTSRKNLATGQRGHALARAWASSPPRGHRITLFIGGKNWKDSRKFQNADSNEKSSYSPPTSNFRYISDLNVVSLTNVNDSAYPPQRKSLSMLLYMYRQRLYNEFEWFLRSDDDTYVRLDKLEALLRPLNSSELFYIGQPGQGIPEEVGKLGLEPTDNFCMGGPGVVISRATLIRIGPYLSQCMNEMETSHEDVELGRCVKKHAGIKCTWAFEMQKIFYHDQNGMNAFSGDLNAKYVHRAITLHPAKRNGTMTLLHEFFKRQKAIDLRHKYVSLSEELDSISEIIGTADQTHSTMDSREDVWPYSFFTSEHSYCTGLFNCPRRFVETYSKYAYQDIFRQITDSLNRPARHSGKWFNLERVSYGMSRWHPIYGSQNIMHVQLNYRKLKVPRSKPLRITRIVWVDRKFAPLEIVEEMEFRTNYFGEKSHNLHTSLTHITIHFILPVSGTKREELTQFLRNFEQVCLETGEKATLTVVFYENSGQSGDESALNRLRSFQSKYPTYVYLIILHANASSLGFNRAEALNLGAASKAADSLLFLIDVDIVFEREVLDKIRHNAVMGRTIYFPVVYSEYNPAVYDKENSSSASRFKADMSDLRLFAKKGYFRSFGFGMIAIYKQDFDAALGFDTKFNGWGLEDVRFAEKFIKNASLNKTYDIFRSPEPHLIHLYHDKTCNRSTMDAMQWKMCQGSKIAGMGSPASIFDWIFT